MNHNAVKDYHEYIIYDVLGGLPNLTSRPMFGGYGLYLNRTIFAIITGVGEIRFKVDDTNRQQYIDMNSEPFTYDGYKSKKPITMNYYTVPEEVLEDRDKVTEWAYQSANLKSTRKPKPKKLKK